MSLPLRRAGMDPPGSSPQSVSPRAELSARFERFVAPIRDQLYRHAYRMSQSHEDAEDLVQKAMLKAYKAFDRFEVDTNFNAWAFRNLTNTYINAYRKNKRQPAQCSTEEIMDQRLAKVCAVTTLPGMRSSEDEALDLLPDNDIKAAMQALPQQFRDVVYYADVEGLRYREIAAIMNTRTGTVMSRLRRGRQRLRMLLGDGFGEIGQEALPAAG